MTNPFMDKNNTIYQRFSYGELYNFNYSFKRRKSGIKEIGYRIHFKPEGIKNIFTFYGRQGVKGKWENSL